MTRRFYQSKTVVIVLLSFIHFNNAVAQINLSQRLVASGCLHNILKQRSAHALSDSLIINNDTTICKNNSVTLSAVAALSYNWSPATGLSNTTIANPVAAPLTTTTYFVNSETVGNNLVVNGNFSNGNTGFTSGYNYIANNVTEAQYFVGTNPQAWNSAMGTCPDHTSGTGNMLLVNGAPVADVSVWKQTVTVVPNTNYAFSAWLQAVFPVNPAQLQFSINGNTIGTLFNAVLPVCNWKQFYTIWNSGNNTSAVISIVNKNTLVQGNDFALDDISFGELMLKTDSVKITVMDKPVVTASNDTSVCNGKPLQLNASGAVYYRWDQPLALSDTNIANPVARPVKDTFFVVKGYNAPGCFAADTVKVTVLPGTAVDFSFVQDVCNPKAMLFSNESISTLANPVFSWDFGNATSSVVKNPPTVFYAAYNTYPVTLKTAGVCGDSITKNILVNVLRGSIIKNRDTAICGPANIPLSTLPVINYCWSPAAGLSNTTIANPVATPLVTTTYFVNALVSGNNLALNGDFSAGNIGFTSAYNYSASGIPEGVYYVDKNSYPWHPFLGSSVDHTTGTGNMMLVNGAPVPDVAVWKQSINILPNTNYVFSLWLQSIFSGNPAQLQFSINGKTIGALFTASATSFVWQQFYTTWNSGNNTAAVISVINKNTGVTGNDFALDDISFTELTMKQDSVKITVAGKPIVNAGIDTALCKGDSIKLNAVGTAFYNWDNSPFLSALNIANPIAKPLKDTFFIVKGYDIPGCFAADTVNVTVKTLPTLTVSKDTTICNGKSIVLAAQSNAAIFNWFPFNTLSSGGVSNPLATPKDTTKYFLTVTSGNGCTLKDSVVVRVAPLPIIASIKDSAFCSGTGITLATASNGVSFAWAPAAGLNDSTLQSPFANPATIKTYIVTAKNASKCEAADTVTVTVLSIPVVTSKSADDSVCTGASKQLFVTATNAVKYLWSPATGLDNVNVYNPLASPTSAIKYFVKLTGANNCSLTDSVSLGIRQFPVISISPATADICAGDTLLVTVTGGHLYKWAPTIKVANATAAATRVYPIVSTLYTIHVTDTVCHVSGNITANITVKPTPVLLLAKSNDADCVIGTVKLSASGASTYLWFPGETLINAATPTPTATPYQTTMYHVKGYGFNDCVKEDSIRVKVITGVADNGYQVPSAFTPNGDGTNDCFGVKQWGYVTDLQLAIYNRFGEKVFTSNSIYHCWDGNYKGVPQQAGTFVYVVVAKGFCGNIYRKGLVVLIR